MIGKKMLALFFAALPSALVFVAPDIHGFVSSKIWTVADRRWTTGDLAEMSKAKTMAAAVAEVTSAAGKSRAQKPLKLSEIKERIDATTASDIRSAILVATSEGNKKMTMAMDKKIAGFAETVDPAATCATADTAGGHSLNACVNRCRGSRISLAWGKRNASCYMMCTLAMAPCKADLADTTILNGLSTMVMEKAWTAIDIAAVVIWFYLKTIVAFMVLVMLTLSLYVKVESHAIEEHTLESNKKLDAERRALVKLKASVIVEVHANLVRRRGFCTWHDNAAWVTYQLAQKKAGLRILEGIVSRREKSAMAPRLEAWKVETAAMAIDEID